MSDNNDNSGGSEGGLSFDNFRMGDTISASNSLGGAGIGGSPNVSEPKAEPKVDAKKYSADATAAKLDSADDTKEEPVDYNKSLNELIGKAGLTYKSNGKTYKVKDIESLLRVASKSQPIDEALADIDSQRQKIAPIADLIQRMVGDDEDASEEALLQLLPRERVMKMAEKMLRAQYEEELNGGPLTEREKALKAEVEAHKRKEQEEMTKQERQREEQRAQQEQQVVRQMADHVAANVAKALDILDLPDRAAPLAVQLMKPIMKSMLANGIKLDPETLAEKVGPMFEEMLSHKVKNLEGEKLLKFLGEDTGKKYKKALLGQLSAGKPTPVVRTGTSTKKSDEQQLTFADRFVTRTDK